MVEAEVFADVLGMLGVRDGEDEAEPHPQLFQVHLITTKFKSSYFEELCGCSEEGSYFRLIDFCVTQF